MGMEIERKFTVRKLPDDIEKYDYHYIEQGYLNVHPAIRVRKEDDHFYMTYKGAAGVVAKKEYNMELDESSYDHLLKKADGNIITKKRYLIPINENAFSKEYLDTHADDAKAFYEGGIKIELDIFEGFFEGLVIAEVEFPSIEASENYNPPHWFKEDVTGRKEYSNAQLTKLDKFVVEKA
ncbi:CYTH domain-containing protein [Butyrivibrio fibrisolvens]|uniref:CYTH domain-containing protein n=1 Tax=Butyrivibrio fibrisolvens TaxID=831 RepID=UPI0003B35F03|nr:CYTH domain-containing protein [Butyrivibrio fibrisolvens]